MSSQTTRSYFMNNFSGSCNVHVIYRNGLAHTASAQALQSVWATTKIHKHKQTAGYDLQSICRLYAHCSLASTPQQMIHPQRFCICCKLSMQRTVSALIEEVHHRCSITPFQWQRHTNEECKVNTRLINNCWYNLAS